MICNNLYKCIDDGDEIIGVFLDLTKAFDKVWHKGLLHKLKCIGITGNLYNLIESYLINRKQLVTLNGCKSEPLALKAGVPQGSVLGPLLFLVYINDISDDLNCETYMFADDTSIFKRIANNDATTAANVINNALARVHTWSKKWLVNLNPSKTIVMLFSRKRVPSVLPNIYIGNDVLQLVNTHKHLGLTFTNSLSWSTHIDAVVTKCNRQLGMLKKFKYIWSHKALETCYKSFVRPVIEYGSVIYDNCLLEDVTKLEGVQLEAARLVSGAKRCTSHDPLYREVGWQSLQHRRNYAKLVIMYKMVNDIAPSYLCGLLKDFRPSATNRTRHQANNKFIIPKCKISAYEKSFIVSSLKLWNNLQNNLCNMPSTLSFKTNLAKLYTCKKPILNTKSISRTTQVQFSQIRMGFSNLNDHLFMKGCTDDRKCDCGAPKEDTKHYFLICQKYSDLRNDLTNNIHSISDNLHITLNTLLFGNDSLTDQQNTAIIDFTCQYIVKSKRF